MEYLPSNYTFSFVDFMCVDFFGFHIAIFVAVEAHTKLTCWRLWTNSRYPPVVKLWELTVKCQFFNFKNAESSSHHGCSTMQKHTHTPSIFMSLISALSLTVSRFIQHHSTPTGPPWVNGLFLWNSLTDTSMCQLVYSPWYVIVIVNSIRIDEHYTMTYLYVYINICT